MYYKRGEWSLSSGWSDFLGDENEPYEGYRESEWEEMDEEEQWETRLENSREDIHRKDTWGVAAAFQGTVYAEG